MLMRRVKIPLHRFLAGLAVAAMATSAQAQSPYDGKSVEELDRMLTQVVNRGKKLRTLTRLQEIGGAIIRRPECQNDYNLARQTHRQLSELNTRYRGRANSNYQHEASKLRRQNRQALSNYKGCFTRVLNTHHRWPDQQVTDYQSFRQLFRQLAVETEGQTSAQLNRQADEIYAARQRLLSRASVPFAQVTVSTNDVTLRRNGRRVRLTRGMQVLSGDDIQTGSNGRLAVTFTEILGNARRGPFTLSAGPNTHLAIGGETNMTVRDRSRETVMLTLNLVHGSVRVYNTGTGFDSQYVVRAGEQRTRLHGGDAVVSYYPKRALLNVKLRSGSATVEQAGGKGGRLRPNTQVSVRRGVAERVLPLRDSQWNAAMRASGALGVNERESASAPVARDAVARQDILLRAASREAVNEMLSALRDVDTRRWLRSLRGQALANARNTLRGTTLDRALARLGRPGSWDTDCVACQPDRSCQVPTTVRLSGSRQYQALHVVQPAQDGKRYQVDQILQWTPQARQKFNNNRPLCEAELK